MTPRCDMIDVVGTGFTGLDRLYADGDFATGFTFGRAEPPNVIRRVVPQNLLQPGKPLAFTLAVEILEAGMSLHQRLLNEVGRIDLGLNPALNMRPGKEANVVATFFKQFVPRVRVAGLCPLKQILKR